jgi:hypothetical protein
VAIFGNPSIEIFITANSFQKSIDRQNSIESNSKNPLVRTNDNLHYRKLVSAAGRWRLATEIARLAISAAEAEIADATLGADVFSESPSLNGRSPKMVRSSRRANMSFPSFH